MRRFPPPQAMPPRAAEPLGAPPSLPGEIKAAQEDLAREKAEAEEAKANAEKERAEAEEAKRKAEAEAAEAVAAAENAAKEQAEADAAAKSAESAQGGTSAELKQMQTMMERLAAKVIHNCREVDKLSAGGGGSVASGTVQRLQEELMINTQKTENELGRMSEYLDKMSEQLASLWEQKANISEVSTLRADVDALLGQREGDVMQIKDVLSTMESSLRNPSLPSTASSSRGRSGGVQGVVPRR